MSQKVSFLGRWHSQRAKGAAIDFCGAKKERKSSCLPAATRRTHWLKLGVPSKLHILALSAAGGHQHEHNSGGEPQNALGNRGVHGPSLGNPLSLSAKYGEDLQPSKPRSGAGPQATSQAASVLAANYRWTTPNSSYARPRILHFHPLCKDESAIEPLSESSDQSQRLRFGCCVIGYTSQFLQPIEE